VKAQEFKDAFNETYDAFIAAKLIQIGMRIHMNMVENHGRAQNLEDLGVDVRDIAYEALFNKLISEDDELAEILKAARGKIVPWLGDRGSPLRDNPVATKMLLIHYNKVLPAEE